MMQVTITELLSRFLSGSPAESLLKGYTPYPNLKIFKKGAIIFREGQQAGAVFLLCRGKALMVKKKENNLYSTIDTLQSGEMLGIPAVLSGGTYSTSAIAKNKVYAFEVFKDELLQFLMDHPYFHLAVAEKLSRKILHYEAILTK